MYREIFAVLMLWISQAGGQLEKTCLALNIYHEARGETVLGQQVVAHVTGARAQENLREYGGRSICSVVFHRNMREDGKLIAEFSWTSMKRLSTRPLRAASWTTAWRIAGDWLEGDFKVPKAMADARYYLNPKDASPAGLCWFRRHAVPLATIGNHRLYRRPQTVSEWMETHAVPMDCYNSPDS